MRLFPILGLILAAFHLSTFAENDKVINFLLPVKTDGIENKVSSVFGESRGDHFHNGMDISSNGESVLAMGEGKILYTRFGEDDPYGEEFGTGNSVWLDHGNGVYTSYYHLKDGRLTGFLQDRLIGRGEKIGMSGNTGHSSGAHLHFVVLQDFGKTILDPMKFLPPIEDEVPPQIGNLLVHVGDKYTQINDGENINVSRPFPVTVGALDAGKKPGQRRGIAQIQAFLNGEPLKKAGFSSLTYDHGEWKNPEGFRFSDLYFRDQYYLGNLDFRNGENTIKILAWDFRGNLNEKSFTFYVTRIR
ncbi:peptidase, M23 family [Leptospira inadai serovar Lyme str. 10]|uniref:Peptidase, M23 family n=2 Tax=Leptospira inadai serovar Lyme TaxID=293084 RepID=V6H7S1_9LEPT|nr:M23 family metallopeptidase [Leptospira inadai]EQA34786.1 peptidase, M23 family [Leptospira inadai serovar Lyme str. 10]PNV75947.1 peptidase M23 [Leptospira inadai serovar Lyme]